MAPDVKRTFAFLTMGWYGVWSFFRKHSFVDGSHCHAVALVRPRGRARRAAPARVRLEVINALRKPRGVRSPELRVGGGVALVLGGSANAANGSRGRVGVVAIFDAFATRKIGVRVEGVGGIVRDGRSGTVVRVVSHAVRRVVAFRETRDDAVAREGVALVRSRRVNASREMRSAWSLSAKTSSPDAPASCRARRNAASGEERRGCEGGRGAVSGEGARRAVVGSTSRAESADRDHARDEGKDA